MYKLLTKIFKGLFILGFSFTIEAKSEFCQGYEEGYKSVKGNNAFVPMCPFEPVTPFNSTPFREGLKKGIADARRS
tara:strand:+ start:144 stop:371 length:228 start_codon:yes stop_codon:yes gene_type:complete